MGRSATGSKAGSSESAPVNQERSADRHVRWNSHRDHSSTIQTGALEDMEGAGERADDMAVEEDEDSRSNDAYNRVSAHSRPTENALN
jgi:hypothetical protein